MKTITILSLVFLTSISLFSQDAFERLYPMNGRDMYSANMAQTSDGGYLLLSDVRTSTPEDSTQINITKVNPKGNIDWSKDYLFEGNRNLLAKNLQLLEQDSFIFSVFEYGTKSHNVLCKAAPNGDLVWSKAYGDPEDEADGELFPTLIPYQRNFTLVSQSTRYLDPSVPFPLSIYHIYLGFMDSLGTLQHAQVLKPDILGGFFLSGADATLDQGLIITGTFLQNYLIKTDSIGQVEWNKSFFLEGIQSDGRLYTNDVISTLDTGYLAFGYWSDPNMPFPSHLKGFAIKFDRNGIPEWSVDMGLNPFLQSNLHLDRAINTDDGGYILSGQYDGFANQERDRIVAIKLDSLGNVVWKNKFHNFSDTILDTSNGLVPTQDGGFAIYADNHFQPYLIKLDATGSSSCEDSLELFIGSLFIDTDTFTIESIPVDTTEEREVTIKDFNGFTVPVLSLESPPPFCEDEPIEWTFDATLPGAVSYEWNTGETTDSITVTEEGMYIVDVRIEEDGCYNLCDTATISTMSPPMAQISDLGNFCLNNFTTLAVGVDGAIDSLVWSTGETTPSIEVSEGGNYSVMVFNRCGMGEASIEVQAIAPQVTINSTGNLCVEGSATLSLNIQGVADSIVWSTGENTPTIMVSELDTYSVKVFNQCGFGEASFEIEEVLPIAAIDDIVGNPCVDSMAILEVLPQFADSIVWNTGANTPSINITEAGMYNVEVFNQCGSDMATIEVPEILPEVTLNALDSVCFGKETVLFFDVTNANANNFSWFQDDILLENETNDTLIVTEEGLYKIVVANNCDTDEEEYEVACTFEDCVQVPNVFTPNGDNTNEDFSAIIQPTCAGVITIRDMRIYNRWGQIVFESTTGEAWNGEFENKLAPSDVYIYYIETFNSSPEEGDGVEIFKGDVTLVR